MQVLVLVSFLALCHMYIFTSLWETALLAFVLVCCLTCSCARRMIPVIRELGFLQTNFISQRSATPALAQNSSLTLPLTSLGCTRDDGLLSNVCTKQRCQTWQKQISVLRISDCTIFFSMFKSFSVLSIQFSFIFSSFINSFLITIKNHGCKTKPTLFRSANLT